MLKALGHLIRLAVGKLRQRGRSPEWPALERRWLDLHPRCAACGCVTHLQVHHIRPVHLFPELELDPTNLVTLCMNEQECHLRIGHGGNFRYWVPGVELLAARALAYPDSRTAIEAAAKSARRDAR